MGFLVFLIVGGLAGYIASVIADRDSGMGVIGNIIVGWIGAGIANFLFGGNVSLSHPTLGGFVAAIVGAVILLVIVNLFTRSRPR